MGVCYKFESGRFRPNRRTANLIFLILTIVGPHLAIVLAAELAWKKKVWVLLTSHGATGHSRGSDLYRLCCRRDGFGRQ